MKNLIEEYNKVIEEEKANDNVGKMSTKKSNKYTLDKWVAMHDFTTQNITLDSSKIRFITADGQEFVSLNYAPTVLSNKP